MENFRPSAAVRQYRQRRLTEEPTLELVVAFVGDRIAVRDTQDRSGPVLVFTPAEWRAFLAGAKDGEFG